MACGGSVGEGYGPMIVSTRKLSLDQVKKTRIAVPGTLTTAYLTLRLFAYPDIETVTVVPFDKIIPAVVSGEFDAGLIIHEGQLTYANDGLIKLLDLGQWWREQTGLVLPLGGNAIRRSLGRRCPAHGDHTNALRSSIQHGLDNRDEALDLRHAVCALDLDTPTANRFVGMYVNERTLDYGDRRQATPSASSSRWATTAASSPSNRTSTSSADAAQHSSDRGGHAASIPACCVIFNRAVWE